MPLLHKHISDDDKVEKISLEIQPCGCKILTTILTIGACRTVTEEIIEQQRCIAHKDKE